ncbi:hypothetical protein [Haloplanus salinarum]|uniref:hypothetical protein n=1 Tax=Haloplanus salinarum TaxID=1912324 RepID=UPI00214C9746|nr:hypothetical protein [Haloplanus salinarum]
MTNRVISDYITPADEIQSADGGITADNLLDEVSLYNLYDSRDSPEQDAERILNITYPTETLSAIIERTAEKFDDSSSVSEGAHIIGGEFGSGKSHIELVLYHLLSSPKLGEEWLQENDIDATLPSNAQTTALQMLNLDRNYDKLHVAVGDYLDIDEWQEGNPPSVHEIRDALDDRPTAVFIDEFERWFGMSGRADYRDDNLGFLQNLLEAAGRDDTPLAVYVSLLYEEADVESILPRTNPFRHDLSRRRDEKIRFLLHRLVGDVSDPNGLESLAKEYTDVYRNNGQIQLSDYQDMEGRIEDYYPFHPTALETLMDKFSEQQGHQDARGLLHLLTEILADNYHEVDLILTGDIDVFEYTGWFRFIDEELVSKYLNDYHRLGEASTDERDSEKAFGPHVEELLNIVLLHSLARGGEEGANKRQMLMGTMRKGKNAHEIVQTFKEDVYGHAWHVFRINGEYAFDTDENPAARIEKKAEDIHKNTAIHRVERLVTDDLFGGHSNVHILDPVNTEQDIPDSKTLKIVVSLSAKQNQLAYNQQFEELTTGQEREFNNTIALFTPQKRSSVDSNTGIRELARKVVAGEQLDREEEVLPEGFNDIHEQNYQNLLDRVRDKYGTVHVSTDRGLVPEDISVAEGEDFYTATIDVIRPDISQVRSEVEEVVEEKEGGGIQYQYLLNDFYRNTKYPTLTDEQELKDAIDELCRDEIVKVGSYFGKPVGSIGSDTVLVHEDYVQTVEEEDDEPATITVDSTSMAGGGSLSTEGQSTLDSEGDGESDTVSGATAVFECPECGEELQGTSCECGFEFDASDIKEGKVTVEGGDATSLVEQFEALKDEVEEEDLEGTTTSRFPAFDKLDATDKPSLIDTLERELGIGWKIHTVNLTYSGTLDADGVSSRGLDEDDLAERVTTEETLEIDPEEPLSRNDLLNGVLLRLDVPDDAEFEVWLEVEKDE